MKRGGKGEKEKEGEGGARGWQEKGKRVRDR